MRKICIINQKGGVGKTTTALNLASGLSRQDKKVLLIDLDAQGNIASSMKTSSEKTLYNYLIENAELKECITPAGKNLDIIRSDETLTKAETIITKQQEKNVYVLREKFKEIKNYDYVIIDCAPSLGILNQNAMLYCEEAIIPASTDFLGLDGLKKMIAAINELNNYFDHNLKITSIIPTMYDSRNKTCRETLQEMQNLYYTKLTEPIRINSKLKEAPIAKKSIFSYAPKSRGAKDYAGVVNIIMAENNTREEITSQYAETET